jgi:short-chain Z-isoprenyl diphosphate synthase
VGLKDVAYGAYERRLASRLQRAGAPVPHHVGVILDGNRRWAKAVGASSEHGHQRGADKIVDLLGWCDDAGVELVTLWLLSTDNLTRPEPELAPLLGIIEGVVADLARPQNRWTLRIVGRWTCCPPRPPAG